MIEPFRVNKTNGLYHVDILTKMAIRTHSYIKLVKWSSMSNNKTNNQANGGMFDQGTEGFLNNQICVADATFWPRDGLYNVLRTIRHDA